MSTRQSQLSVSQIASLAGTTSRAVRFYESQGILQRARRTDNGYRAFTPEDVSLLHLVVRLRAAGLGLADIREIVRMREHGIPPPHHVIALLEARISQLDRELASMHESRGGLAQLVRQAMAASSAGQEVRLCRLVGAGEFGTCNRTGLTIVSPVEEMRSDVPRPR
jgi:DNA-binding transcriptional MerR regulator